VKKDKTIPSKDSPTAYTEFASSILKKQFRLGDWMAEKVIKSVAFLSITFVILIFFFVFRETLPIFKDNQASESSFTETSATDESFSPEAYDSGAPETDEAMKPEVYGAAVEEMSATKELAETTPITKTGSENQRALSTLSSKDWQPVSDHPRFGLLPLFLGTLKITLIAILFAAPIAILAAIYTALFAPANIREIIKPAIELLAGFPSVVIGFFALMVLASFFQDLFGYSGRLNGFVGGVAMALAAIPVIYTLTEDALTAVPNTYMEASLGLGASLRQTAFMVILPTAIPGIFASVLLGVGRVFGETMIALMATGNAAIISLNL
jgi:phosphate transport system permease protein